MSKRNDEKDGRASDGAARRQRLAAALRDNLAKRKAQTRARHRAAAAEGADAAAGEAAPPDGLPDDDPKARLR